MNPPIDTTALRAKLREYDPSLPRCSERVEERRNYAPDYVSEEERGEWDMPVYNRCSRPAGHDAPCRASRLVMGWPGFATLTSLLDEVERLRDNAEARERVMRREGDLLRAAQREVDELRAVYAALRQTSADLCVVCGWRFFVPDVGCQGCERARLAGEVDDLRLQHEANIIDNMHAYEEGVAEGECRERAAAVAWLRDGKGGEQGRVEYAADIERGEHRREEE